MKTTKRNIGTLAQDEKILSLRPVDPLFVSRYRQAMRGGDRFPPLIVDQESRIIAGNHRYTAYMAEFGTDYTVDVVVRKYASEADRIEDAIRDNARHGNPMDGITRKRAVLMLSELGRTPLRIASLLGVSVRRVEDMAGMSVMVVGAGIQPLKRGLEHIAGTQIQADEYEQHRTADKGIPAAQVAAQLTRWIRNGWIDWSNAKTATAMNELREAMEASLSVEDTQKQKASLAAEDNQSSQASREHKDNQGG